MKFSSNDLRRWCRLLHRDLSYFFAGMVLIYALSGIAMNHRDTFNPDYAVSRTRLALDLPAAAGSEYTRAEVEALLAAAGVRVLVQRGAVEALTVDLARGEALYERLTRRYVWSALTRLHYNPGRWWTLFADAFAGGLILITLTGLLLVKGPKGLRGRGGIELAAGILVPLLFLLI